MLSTPTYVDNLSDEQLYKELKSHGFPAGPVVASTRSLYRRKLIQILDNSEEHDEPSPSQPDNSRWSSPHLSSPSQPDSSRWSSPRLSYERDEISSTLNFSSHSSPLYRRYDDDDSKSRFSYLESKDRPTSQIPGSTLLSKDSSYAFRKSLSGIRDEDSFSRLRKTYTDPLSRPELSSRYRSTVFTEDYSGRRARQNREQSKKSLRLVMCGALVVVAILFLYVVYSAWSENDPYRHIEEEAKKLVEESNM